MLPPADKQHYISERRVYKLLRWNENYNYLDKGCQRGLFQSVLLHSSACKDTSVIGDLKYIGLFCSLCSKMYCLYLFWQQWFQTHLLALCAAFLFLFFILPSIKQLTFLSDFRCILPLTVAAILYLKHTKSNPLPQKVLQLGKVTLRFVNTSLFLQAMIGSFGEGYLRS